MELYDFVMQSNFPLSFIYDKLMELDSLESTINDQIGSVRLQSMRAEYVESTTDAEDGLGDSYQKALDQLEQLRNKVVSRRDVMRKAANAYSRSRIRSLNILDLPDELLRMIFEKSRNRMVTSEHYFFVPDPSSWDGIKEIKNIRLTCRRFCNTSSHLLLRHIDVCMSPSSLAHLDEVARHPLLSKGIQAVRVHLNYFSAELATDLTHFITLATMHLEDSLLFSKSIFQEGCEDQPFNTPREKLGPAIDKAELILEEWLEFFDALVDSQEDQNVFDEGVAKSRAVAGLASAHEIYRQQYFAQESVLKDGRFVQAILTAMSKMPTVRRLFVGDDFRDFKGDRFKYVKPFVDAVEDPESLAAEGTVRTLDWDTARSKQLVDQPKEIFLQLLMAVFNSDIPVDYLCVDLTSAAHISIPADQEQLQQLAAGTENLRVFDFRGRDDQKEFGPIVDFGPEQVTSFCSLVSSCMGGKALTRLDLDLSFTLDESAPQPPVSMGSLLVSRHCPDLKVLRLSYFPLHLKQLKRFLDALNGPVYINLDHVMLLSGTWAEALDLIRHKSDRHSSVTEPRGAECDDMSEEDMQAIFGMDDSLSPYIEEGKAAWYIRGYIKENPL